VNKHDHDHNHDHDEVDGCLCGSNHAADPGAATEDCHLPPATGGVEGDLARARRRRTPRKPTRTSVED
jgi:hypothetical protein